MDKRSQLVDTALHLFYQNGIHAVGINEVLTRSGIAKKTLYNHFISKDALIEACIIERDRRFMMWFEARCVQHQNLTEFVEQIFCALDDWINGKVSEIGRFNGCFFVNATAEYSDEGTQIHQLCKQHKLHIKAVFETKLNGLISDPVPRHELVELLLLLKEGCINIAHVMRDKEAALKAKALALLFCQNRVFNH